MARLFAWMVRLGCRRSCDVAVSVSVSVTLVVGLCSVYSVLSKQHVHIVMIDQGVCTLNASIVFVLVRFDGRHVVGYQ